MFVHSVISFSMYLTSHVASCEAAFYFFFANLAQARALQVLVAGSRFLQIISAAFRIFFFTPGDG